MSLGAFQVSSAASLVEPISVDADRPLVWVVLTAIFTESDVVAGQ